MASTDLVTLVSLPLAPSSSTTSSPPFFSFLSLPPEIRNQIYTLLLQLPPYSPYQSSPSYVHPQILSACRQINDEAAPLLYACNTFLAHASMLASFPRLREWYSPIRESVVVPRIRRFHLRVRLDCDPAYDSAAVAAAFSGLEELSVHVIQSVFLGSDYDNLVHFEAVRGVARVHIFGSTRGFEDYVAWLKATMESEPGSDAPPFSPEPDAVTIRKLSLSSRS